MKRSYALTGLGLIAAVGLISTAFAGGGIGSGDGGPSAHATAKKRGPRGPAGPAGPRGPQGPQGIQGPAGPGLTARATYQSADAYYTGQPSGRFTVLTTTGLPAGKYMVNAKLRLRNDDASEQTITCQLQQTPASTVVDESTATVAAYRRQTIPFAGLVTIASGDDLTISCDNPGGDYLDTGAGGAKLIALPLADFSIIGS